MSVKVNCVVCRGTKRVDKIGGLHTKECPGCKGLGKIEKNPIEDAANVADVAIVAEKAETAIEPKEDKIEPTLKSKEGKSKNGKGK